MKVIRKGYTYEAENFGDKTKLGVIIKFIQKERDGDSSFVIQDGTTVEEIIDVLIDKMEEFQNIQQSPENWFVIHYLKIAKFFMIERQREKNKRLRLKNFGKQEENIKNNI